MLVFDKANGYHHQFAFWSERQVHFVTRLKKNAIYTVVEDLRKNYKKKVKAKALSDEIIVHECNQW
jgi:hypothetical protein